MFKELNLFPEKKEAKTQQTDFNLLQSSSSFQQVTLINVAQYSLLPECQCFSHFLQRLLSKMIDMKRSKCSTDLFFPAGTFWLRKWAFKGTCDKHIGFEANWCLLMLHSDLHGLFSAESRISNCSVWLALAHTNSQLQNIYSHDFKAAPWALYRCTIMITNSTKREPLKRCCR